MAPPWWDTFRIYEIETSSGIKAGNCGMRFLKNPRWVTHIFLTGLLTNASSLSVVRSDSDSAKPTLFELWLRPSPDKSKLRPEIKLNSSEASYPVCPFSRHGWVPTPMLQPAEPVVRRELFLDKLVYLKRSPIGYVTVYHLVRSSMLSLSDNSNILSVDDKVPHLRLRKRTKRLYIPMWLLLRVFSAVSFFIVLDWKVSWRERESYASKRHFGCRWPGS